MALDLLKLAVGAVSVVGVGLFLWGWRDVRDVFEEAFGDWPHLDAEMWTGRRNDGGVGGNDQSGPSYDARTRHGERF